MKNNNSKKELAAAKAEAEKVIRATEKALKKHISLIKKRERIMSIVAMIERLRGDLRGEDVGMIHRHIQKLNEWTKGFAERAIAKK